MYNRLSYYSKVRTAKAVKQIFVLARKDPAGLLGSNARKTLRWRVFSENGAVAPWRQVKGA